MEKPKVFRNALGDDETVDVSIIVKEAAIQLPLAKHAQEWESMTKDEHPEDVATKKCKTLEENFVNAKMVIMQLPMDLPNSIDDISSDVPSNMPLGVFGDLRVHRSGKVTMKTRKGIVLNVTGGIVDRMSEVALQVDMENNTSITLPQLEGHLVFHPNYNSLIEGSVRERRRMRKVVVVRRSRIDKEAALILLLNKKLYGSIFSSSASEMNVFATASFHHDNLFSLINDGTDALLNRGKGGLFLVVDSRFGDFDVFPTSDSTNSDDVKKKIYRQTKKDSGYHGEYRHRTKVERCETYDRITRKRRC